MVEFSVLIMANTRDWSKFTGLEEFRESMNLLPIIEAIVKCLRCLKEFKSADKVNIRICKDCKEINTDKMEMYG